MTEPSLPEGWISAKVKTAGRVQLGRQRSPNVHSGAQMRPYLRVANVFEDEIRLDSVMEMHFGDADLQRFELRPGDILLNEGQSPQFLGRPAMYRGELPGACFTNSLIRFQASNAVESRFALHLFRHWMRSGEFQKLSQITTNIAHLSAGRFGDMDFPIPPLPEQRRIVSHVDALLEQVNRARGRLDRVPVILKKFRKAVLAAACSGELTREWRTNHDADATSVVATLGAASVSTDDAPTADIPTSWRWVATEDLCERSRAITYGVIKLGDPVADGVPTLRSSDVRPLYIDETGVKKIAPEIAKQYARTFLRGGEVLVTVRGTLGGVAVVPSHMVGFNISREVAQLPIRSEMNADFVALAVASITSQNWLGERAKGVAYTGINIEDLRHLPLPVPPLAEQVEVVECIRRLFALADTIERRVHAATARADKLPQAILSKAFSGELVPTEAELARVEGRTYETAEELLRRVTQAGADEGRRPSSVRTRRSKADADPPPTKRKTTRSGR